MRLLFIAAAVALVSTTVTGQVHKCVDSSGRISYSQIPCQGAQRGGQVLGREATEMRNEPDGYRHQLQMESLNRTHQQQRELIDGPAPPPQPATSRAASQGDEPPTVGEAEETEKCETYSLHKGCIGGERSRNPNWSARKGYFGSGGPADRKREQQEAAAEAARAEATRKQSLHPPRVSKCNDRGCWDNAGNRYNRIRDDNEFFSTNGKFCRIVGQNMTCN